MICGQDAVRLSSMFSHLATADCVDMDDYTDLQLSRFKEMTEFVMARIPYDVKRHVLNSAGIIRISEHHYDMVRLGIGLYGANTLPPEIEKPLAVVSTLRTVIIAIREWDAGETIGYSRKGVLTRKSRIATIPIGYADGMNRHFGRGNVAVKVNGKDAPTVGTYLHGRLHDRCDRHRLRSGRRCGDFRPAGARAKACRHARHNPLRDSHLGFPRVKRVYYRE